MKLKNAIKKLEREGYELEEKSEGRSYIARNENKNTIQINANGLEEKVHYTAWIVEESNDPYEDSALNEVMVSSVTNAIKNG